MSHGCKNNIAFFNAKENEKIGIISKNNNEILAEKQKTEIKYRKVNGEGQNENFRLIQNYISGV